MSVWTLDNVSQSFPSGPWFAPTVVNAVRGVSLQVEPGARLAIIGESGSGKSTLVRTGLGLLRPTAGSVHLFGNNTASWRESDWRSARHHAQLLFQDPAAMLHPAVALGVLLEESCRVHRPGVEAAPVVAELLEAVGLPGRQDARLHHLSGGEQRRAGIARVLMAETRLLVADEPTAGLDAALKADLVSLMLERAGPECAFVLVSHDLPLVLWACSQVAVMDAGELVDTFHVSNAQDPSRHPRTQALFAAAGIHPQAVPQALEGAP